MKVFSIIILVVLGLASAQCSSSKKDSSINKITLEDNSKINIESAYFIKETTSSSISIFFTNLINKNNYTLKKVYFRGMIGKIQYKNDMYFSNLKPPKKDIIMTNETNGEYGNTLPNTTEVSPFTLKENSCIISYIEDNVTKYTKVDSILEKQH